MKKHLSFFILFFVLYDLLPLILFDILEVGDWGIGLMVLIAAGILFAYELYYRSKGFNRWEMAKQSWRNISYMIVEAFLFEWSIGAPSLLRYKRNEFDHWRRTYEIIDNTSWFLNIYFLFLIISFILAIKLATKDFKVKMGLGEKPQSGWKDQYWEKGKTYSEDEFWDREKENTG